MVAVASPTEGPRGYLSSLGPHVLIRGMMTRITRSPRMGHAVTIQ